LRFQVAAGDRGDDAGDAAHLARQVGRHHVHVVGQVLPCAADALNLSLTAQLAFRANLARDARHLRGEGVELVHHRVDRGFQLQDFAADIDGDLLRQIAGGDRRGDLGNVADLAGQVGGHHVDVVGEVFPGARDTLNLRLAAELSFRAHLAGHARHLRGKGIQLIHHGVDGGFELEDLALDLHGDLLGQVAVGDRGRSPRRCCAPGREVAAIKFTLSVRSFQVPPTPLTCAWPPSLPPCRLRAPRASLPRRRS
jgi:hypothetical protein